MDLQVVLIGIAAFVISALLIYVISVFGIKEKSFEEAIAEQRRRQEEEQEKLRKDKKAEKDKKKKKPAKEKPAKEKPPLPTPPPAEPEVPKEHKMVNLEIDPEIIEPLMTERSVQKTPKKSKTPKPILHNKDEKPLVAKETQEVIHHIPHPKDDLELKHEHERKGKRSEKRPDSPRESKKERRPVEEEIFVEKMSKQMMAPSMEERAPAKKSKNIVEASMIDSSALISSVRNAQLNDQDTQTLIEILLNKQGGGGSMGTMEWNKKVQKGDPVALLRKQLEEKERSLQEEQQLAMANNNKCKELKAEMAKEKTRYSNLETQYQEKLSAQTQEIQALHAKMRSTHDNHLIESSKMQAHIQSLESRLGDGGHLKEENRALKETIERMKAEAIPVAEFNSLRQKVSIMENELSSNVTKLSSVEKAKKNLEQKCYKLEDDVKKSKSAESQAEGVWSKRLDEVNKQLRKTEADKTSLTDKLKAAEKDCTTVKARLQELEKTLTANDTKEIEEKLKTVEQSKLAVETSLKSAEQKLSETEQQKVTLQKELEKLKQENYTLTTEIKTVKERQVGDGQEMPGKGDGKPNGDIHAETAETKIALVQHEKMLSEKDSEIQKLLADVEGKKKELSSLQEQMETQKKKNNELREKNWKAMDALEKAEKSASDKIQSASKESKTQVSEAEKSDEEVLKRLFPEVKVDEKLNHKDWMSAFEKQIAVYITTLSNKASDSAGDSVKVKELEEKNKSLQSQIQDVQARLSSESAKLKEIEDRNKNLQTQLGESSKEKNVISSKVASSESRVKVLESEKKSLQEEIAEVKSKLLTESASSSNTAELEAENQKLKSQTQEYLAVLKVTETKLQQLENSVEGEEKKWQSKAESLQIDLQQAKEELESLREQLKKLKGSEEALAELEFAYRCLEKSLMQISDEMKEKVLTLEEELRKSEDKCSELQSQVTEAEARISSLQLSINDTDATSNDDLLKQIAELKASLEKEQKKSKDLASQTVKLNGIIKTGHDALMQEQELVKKLQQQLETKQGSGTSNSTTEVKELKSKLAEKEKQLDRELTSNKQLSQRLTSSQSSLNEAGTSV